MALDTKFLIFPTCSLTRVRDAYLDGDYIAGSLGKEPWTVTNPIRLCEQFLNCDTFQGILRFTHQYGPINEDYFGERPKLQPGEAFRFRIESWLDHRYDCKTLWGSSANVTGNFDDVRTGDHFLIEPGKTIQFQFADVSRLIKFFMLVIPRDKQRVCENPDCCKFFFAQKRSDVYCGSKACKRFGDLKVKRECWDRNRAKYLANRREKQQLEER